MFVYRVEHPVDKIGPYQSGFRSWTLEKMAVSHCGSDKHPVPRLDYGIELQLWDYPDKDYCCGCRSAKQLLQWFDDDRWWSAFDYNEFVVAVYNVPDEHVWVGEYQVVFDREQSGYVGKLYPIEFKQESKHHATKRQATADCA